MSKNEGSQEPLKYRFLTFNYLTGNTPLPSRKDKKSYKQLHIEALQLKQAILKAPKNKKASLKAPDENFLRPPEEVCLVHNSIYSRKKSVWPNRYLAARGKDNSTLGYSFFAFENQDAYINVLARAVPPNNLFNSLVEYAKICRLFIDLEEEYPKDMPTIIPDTPLQFFDRCVMGLTFLFASFEANYGLNICYRSRTPHFTNACMDGKNSFHINLALPFSDIVALNEAMSEANYQLNQLRESQPDHPLVKALLKKYCPPIKNPHQPPNPWIIDFGVYTPHRIFRTGLQMKTPKKNNPLVPFCHVSLKMAISGNPKQKGYWLDNRTLPERLEWIKHTMIHKDTDRERFYRLPPLTSVKHLKQKLEEWFSSSETNFITPADAASKSVKWIYTLYYINRENIIGVDKFQKEVNEAAEYMRKQVLGNFPGDHRRAWITVLFLIYLEKIISPAQQPCTNEIIMKAVNLAASIRNREHELNVWARLCGMINWTDSDSIVFSKELQTMNPNQVVQYVLLYMRISHMFAAEKYYPTRSPRPYSIDQFLRFYAYDQEIESPNTFKKKNRIENHKDENEFCYDSGDDEDDQYPKKKLMATKFLDNGWYKPANESDSTLFEGSPIDQSEEQKIYNDQEWREIAKKWYSKSLESNNCQEQVQNAKSKQKKSSNQISGSNPSPTEKAIIFKTELDECQPRHVQVKSVSLLNQLIKNNCGSSATTTTTTTTITTTPQRIWGPIYSSQPKMTINWTNTPSEFGNGAQQQIPSVNNFLTPHENLADQSGDSVLKKNITTTTTTITTESQNYSLLLKRTYCTNQPSIVKKLKTTAQTSFGASSQSIIEIN